MRRRTLWTRLAGLLRATFWLAVLGLFLLGLWFTRLGAHWPSVYVMTDAAMEPTVAEGEYFLAWSPAGVVQRGDLVLFEYLTADGESVDVLRRLAALPGDTVRMDSGVVHVNGEPRDWPFRILRPRADRSELAITGDLYDWGPWIVPSDSVVVLADTRDISGWPDSRFFGFLPRERIFARATRVLVDRPLR